MSGLRLKLCCSFFLFLFVFCLFSFLPHKTFTLSSRCAVATKTHNVKCTLLFLNCYLLYVLCLYAPTHLMHIIYFKINKEQQQKNNNNKQNKKELNLKCKCVTVKIKWVCVQKCVYMKTPLLIIVTFIIMKSFFSSYIFIFFFCFDVMMKLFLKGREKLILKLLL